MSQDRTVIRPGMIRISAEPEAVRMAIAPDESATPLAPAAPLPARPYLSTWRLDPDWRTKLLKRTVL